MNSEGSVNTLVDPQPVWKLFVDGSSNKEGAGARIALCGPGGRGGGVGQPGSEI